MRFAGIGTSGWRSFGGESIQTIGPLNQILVIAGENNVGKSNALAMLHLLANSLSPTARQPLAQLVTGTEDIPRGQDQSSKLVISVGVEWAEEDYEAFALNDYLYSSIRRALEVASAARGGGGIHWFDFAIDRANPVPIPDRDQLQSIAAPDEAFDQILFNYVMDRRGGASTDRYENWTNALALWNPLSSIPPINYLPAMRRLSASGTEVIGQPIREFDRLVEQFLDYQAPSDPGSRPYKQAKFTELQAFLRAVLDDPVAEFQVAGQIVFVRTSNGEMQLSRLGTGIEEILILAAVATFSPESIVCVEEPEIHLHPTLQRQLTRYLAKQTTTRFVMSTHSPHVINSPGIELVQASMRQSHTELRTVLTPAERAELSFAVGARPSDVVQTNYAIWVEGPSDRVYLSAWLSAVDNELVEGAHFSIVFYGGRLLSHVSFDDDEVDDLIHLQSIARKYAVLIDSDRDSEGDSINATKSRIVSEADRLHGRSWVTAGREIENYVPVELMRAAIAEEYEARTYVMPDGQWERRLSANFADSTTGPSKVSVAKRVVSSWTPESWTLDLLEQVTKLAADIRLANDLTVP